jgi:Domain of unknown function (DUF4170)
MSRETVPKQLLHLVFGGELADLNELAFKDLERLDIVGIYPNDLEPDAVGPSPR